MPSGRCEVLCGARVATCCNVLQRVLSLVGMMLFFFSGTEFRRVLCRLLTLLSHNDASELTLKSFRAGRATSLAASGHSIGEILIAGESKSSAFLKYCQAVPALLNVVLEDDPEDDHQFGIDGICGKRLKKKEKSALSYSCRCWFLLCFGCPR